MAPLPRETLLTIPNDHVTTDGGTNHPPDFDAAHDYVAYAPNIHGEQMVFVQRRGEPTATLYHGDCGWEPVTIRDGLPIDLVAESGELLWIAACWHLSAFYRREHRARPWAIIEALDSLGSTLQTLAMLQTAAEAAAEQAERGGRRGTRRTRGTA
jgi:hypothetical protein